MRKHILFRNIILIFAQIVTPLVDTVTKLKDVAAIKRLTMSINWLVPSISIIEYQIVVCLWT